MIWKIIFYNQKVKTSVDNLENSLKGNFYAITDKMLIQGPNLGMPFTKALGNGLFEIRVKGVSGIARGLYCTISMNRIVILNVFIKKSEAIPYKELKLAKQRMKEVKK
jgi:phage-related protein